MIRNLILALIAFTVAAPLAPAEASVPYEVAKLKYDKYCILKAVAKQKNIVLRDDVPVPPVYLESETPLKQFQDAIEPQWGMRPSAFLNAYILATNDIYVIDDNSYYKKVGRFIDDSLAHELVHFIQVKYQNYDVQHDESAEADAIAIQTWFRETFMVTGENPCP